MQVADVYTVQLPNITNNVYVWYGDRLLFEGTDDQQEDYFFSGNQSLITFGFDLGSGDIVRIITTDPNDGTPVEWRQIEFTSKVKAGSPVDTELGIIR